MGSKDDLPQPSAPQVSEGIHNQIDGYRPEEVDSREALPQEPEKPTQNKLKLPPGLRKAVTVEPQKSTQNKPKLTPGIIKIISGEKIPERRGDFMFPPLHLLTEAPDTRIDNDVYTQVMQNLIRALERQGIKVIPHEIHVGPVYTRYQFTLAPGVTYKDVAQKSSLLAQSLGVPSIKIVPIQGQQKIAGAMVPNEQPNAIYLRDIVESRAYAEARAEIPLILGKGYSGVPIIEDLQKLGHLLVVGQSGSGKTSFIQSALSGLLYHSGPDALRFVIADSKILEYNMASALPQMLIPVVTEGNKLSEALKWIAAEMERRYQIFTSINVRNITGFNKRVDSNTEDRTLVPSKKIPHLVCIIDDLLDFYDHSKKDIEETLAHLLRLSAATGTHLIISTDSAGEAELNDRIKQRLQAKLQMTFIPSAAESSSNSRGAFRFMPQGNSPVSNGRNESGYVYIMRNDSLPENCFKIGLTRESPERRASELSSATGVPTGFEVVYYRETSDCRASESAIHRELADCRVSRNREFFNCSLELAIDAVNRHCQSFTEGSTSVEGHAPCPSEHEFIAIIEFLKENNDPPCYAANVQSQLDEDSSADGLHVAEDALLADAIDVLRTTKQASTTMLQRRLRIGYNRAARLMEELEERGIVGPENGSRPRDIYVDLDRL